MTPSEAPKALQASECSELLDPTRANCWISAQHQPGKFTSVDWRRCDWTEKRSLRALRAVAVLSQRSLQMAGAVFAARRCTAVDDCGAGRWAEAHIKIARMILAITLDKNWSSFQLANRAPPLSVTDSSIAPSARMHARPHARPPRDKGHDVGPPDGCLVARDTRCPSLAQNAVAGGCRLPCRRCHYRGAVGAQVPAQILRFTLVCPIHGNL